MSRSEYLPIEEEVRHLMNTYFEDTHPKFIIGVSGGPDSMALLYLFHMLDVDVVVVHINYGKRGKESDKDAELVEEMANQWNFDCHTLQPDPEEGEAEGTNFQQWARRFRYNAFRALAQEYEADGIALAHHRDDQIETVLQKLFRGAGLASWSAMEVWNGELFRPLLSFSKKEIYTYCEEKSIPFRVDRGNLQSNFARNFLRNEWLEDLNDHFPGWEENVLRISGQAKLFYKSLEWITDELTDEKDRIDRDRFLRLDPNLSKAVLLHLLKKVDPDIKVSGEALDQLQKLDELQTGKSLQFTESYSLMRDREVFKIVFEEPESLRVLKIERGVLAEKGFMFDGIHFEVEPYENPDFEQALYLDADKLDWPLTLRNWKDGDSFCPFGMDGHQNVSDHLTNRKISASQKRKALVIETFEETICAVIFPPIENRTPPGTIADFAKCDSDTRQCVIVK